MEFQPAYAARSIIIVTTSPVHLEIREKKTEINASKASVDTQYSEHLRLILFLELIHPSSGNSPDSIA